HGLATGEELGLRHHRTTTSRVTTVAAPLLLRFQTRRALDGLRLCDVFDGTLPLARLVALSVVLVASAAATTSTARRRGIILLIVLRIAGVVSVATGPCRKRRDLRRVE